MRIITRNYFYSFIYLASLLTFSYSEVFEIFQIFSQSNTKPVRDVFTNIFGDKKYCLLLNGDCISESCNYCVCKRYNIFVSITRGCLNYTEAYNVFTDKDEQSAHAETKSIPTLNNQLKKNGRCNRLNNALVPRRLYHSCSVKNFFSIDPITNKKNYAHKDQISSVTNDLVEPPFILDGSNCLQCFKEACNMYTYKGTAAVLNVDCLTQLSDESVVIPILVKISGMFQTNDTRLVKTSWNAVESSLYNVRKNNTTPSTTEGERNNSTNGMSNSKIIISLTVIGGILVIIALLIYMRYFRRKYLRRKKTRIAHTIRKEAEKKKSNDQKTNLTYENDDYVKQKELYISQVNLIYKESVQPIVYTSCDASRDTCPNVPINKSTYASTTNDLYKSCDTSRGTCSNKLENESEYASTTNDLYNLAADISRDNSTNYADMSRDTCINELESENEYRSTMNDLYNSSYQESLFIEEKGEKNNSSEVLYQEPDVAVDGHHASTK